jgi:hypothetical protein
MTVLAIQHTFQGLSGLPRDRYVNTWHVIAQTVPPTLPNLEAMADDVKKFYEGGGATSITTYLSPWNNGAGRTVKIYNLDDAIPRAPIYEETDQNALTAFAGTGYPNEVACCLSFAGVHLSGTPQARRRGRVYIGPLNTTCGSITPVGDSRPNPAFRTRMLDAAYQLDQELFTHGARWCVYSPTAGSAVAVSTMSVDDAFDTQRRRGMAATLVESRTSILSP